jgi:PAS domain S-box-containing protein
MSHESVGRLVPTKDRFSHLEDVELLYKFLLESAPDAIFVTDGFGEISIVNSQCERMFGYDRSELLGKNIGILIPKENRDSYLAERAASAQQLKIWRVGQEAIFKALRKDGTEIAVEISLSPLKTSSGILITSIVRDVSAQASAHARVANALYETNTALHKTEGLFKTLVESLKDMAVYCLDESGYVRTWSKGADKILGYTESEIIGKHVSLLFRAEDVSPGSCPSNFETALSKGSYQEDGWRSPKNGKVFWATSTITPMYNPHGKLIGFVDIVQDITEKKKYENELRRARDEAETASRTKSNFLANISHEIRTPLAAILGYSDLLSGSQLGPAARTYFVEIVRKNGEVLSRIINDILDISKIEAGKLEIYKKETLLNEVLADIQSSFAVQIAQKGLHFKIVNTENTPNRLWTDPHRLRQILINLVGNSVKFTEAGNVTLAVQMESPRKLTFVVSDSGPGVPQGTVNQLFTPFCLGDASATRKYGGAGLGLSIALRLTRELGGEVILESTSERGSIFKASIDPGLALKWRVLSIEWRKRGSSVWPDFKNCPGSEGVGCRG